MLLPSLTATLLARILKVSDPEPNGILMVGASYLARLIAAILKMQKLPVVLADASWEDISAARLAGLSTYYGNPVSEHADYNLNLLGIGKLLAITPNTELGVLAGLRFSTEFGKKNIYYLQTKQEKLTHEKYLIAKQHRGSMLFGEDVTYEGLTTILEKGGEIRSTILTEQFDYETFVKTNTHHYIPLFAFDTKNKLHIFTGGSSIKPAVGWTIVAVHMEQEN